jgi:hypothetical protein
MTPRAADWSAVASFLVALTLTAMSQLVNAPLLFLRNEHWEINTKKEGHF